MEEQKLRGSVLHFEEQEGNVVFVDVVKTSGSLTGLFPFICTFSDHLVTSSNHLVTSSCHLHLYLSPLTLY